ncbi:hypothetical protein C8F01DRAFT_1307905 [Mycena amicta]|nr:hypothetical protein C8F01DRAFT_1307905 [Mycena amicta]
MRGVGGGWGRRAEARYCHGSSPRGYSQSPGSRRVICNPIAWVHPGAVQNLYSHGLRPMRSQAVSAASILDVQISCATPANAGDAMECTGVAVAPGTAFDPTQSQIACSIPTAVGAGFSCTSSFATAGTAAFNLGVQLNCDIPHDVGDVLNCAGNAMTAPAPLANGDLLVFPHGPLTEYSLSRGSRASASEEEAPQDEGCPDSINMLGAFCHLSVVSLFSIDHAVRRSSGVTYEKKSIRDSTGSESSHKLLARPLPDNQFPVGCSRHRRTRGLYGNGSSASARPVRIGTGRFAWG